MKKKLVIKYEGKKHFVSYGDIVIGKIGVDKFRMITFNTDYFEDNPAMKEAYEECERIMSNAIKTMQGEE